MSLISPRVVSPLEQTVLKALANRPSRPSELFAALTRYHQLTPDEVLASIATLTAANLVEARGDSISTDQNQVYCVTAEGQAVLRRIVAQPGAFTYAIYLDNLE